MITLSDFKSDTTQDVLEFKDNCGNIFVSDTKFRKELNKKLEVNYRKVYVKKTKPSLVHKSGVLELCEMFILTEKYKLLHFVTIEDSFIS